MAETDIVAGLTPEQWDDKFFVEHVQGNRFAGEMGTDENSVIQINEQLGKASGDTIHFALVNRLTGAGVSNGGTLEGNEEEMDTRSFALTISERANGVVHTNWSAQKSAIDLRNASKSVLQTWAMENTRDRIITALGSINGTAFGSADATARDAWLVDNSDRFLAGAAVGNNASNDHSAALAEIDNTNDQLTTGALSLMKRIARTANPKIRPIRSETDARYYYVVYAPSLCFRDLRESTAMQQAQREVSVQMQNNILFKGGDLYWDGLIIKEIEDIAVVSGAGAGGIDVAPVYLCGAQAIGYGIGQRWKTSEEKRDYGRKMGCAINEMGGFAKMTFGSGSGDTDDLKDHGVVTGFFAAVADA